MGQQLGFLPHSSKRPSTPSCTPSRHPHHHFLGFSFCIFREEFQLEEGRRPSTTTGFRAFSAKTRGI